MRQGDRDRQTDWRLCYKIGVPLKREIFILSAVLLLNNNTHGDKNEPLRNKNLQ